MQLKKHIEYIDYDFQKTKKLNDLVQQSQLSSSGFVEVVVYLNVYIYIYYVYFK